MKFFLSALAVANAEYLSTYNRLTDALEILDKYVIVNIDELAEADAYQIYAQPSESFGSVFTSIDDSTVILVEGYEWHPAFATGNLLTNGDYSESMMHLQKYYWYAGFNVASNATEGASV